MVARQFNVHHNGSEFVLDCDTDDGLEVLKFQIFSLTSILPDDQKISIEGQNLILNESYDLESVSDKLRLVSIHEEPVEDEEEEVPIEELEKSDAELARILQAEEEALFFQQYRASENKEEFEGRVRPYVKQVLMYEDQHRQEAARRTVPVDELQEKALVSLAKEGKFNPSKEEQDHAFLLQLLFWFKQSFRWVNSPPCDLCGSGTRNIGMRAPLPSEINYGGSRVELYRCNHCSSITRFPRYNDPLKLLETRRGRCGEWANCFTLYCRAFDYESRLILDFTDHVWTECFSHYLGRWMHLDPCEGVYDKPLLYEKGWNKKLNYTIAIAKDGVYDVTKRYTRKWHEVLSRRNITTETVAFAVLSSIRKDCRAGYSSEMISVLEQRDEKETEELEREVHRQLDDSLSLPGRQSGAIEWRIARSEMGLKNSLSSSSCPVRKCVDTHVKRIYNALNLLMRYFLDIVHQKNEIIEVLGTLKRLLVDLKRAPFRERKSLVDPKFSKFSEPLMVCIKGLLASLSLKWKLENDEKAYVCLAMDPVQTSLALPVVLDAFDEIINNLNGNNQLELEFPKPNRLSSGSVLGSGEELPAGIATSAFDGTHSSKWEEPNGAKGCWLLYRASDDQMHDLEAYELMSANDAPERDPMDWTLEGSDDGGAQWYVLDKRSSQLFEKRFQRKTYKVDTRRKSNAFRFHFLSVRDSTTQSRFQIGSIDLYAKEN